jgi:hypothetical protein
MFMVNQKQINALADAMLRLIAWRENQLRLKQETKIKRMIKRQLRLRQNSKLRLSD